MTSSPLPFTADLLDTLRSYSPLIQCITNFVSMDIMANTLLAIGASPAMVHSTAEVNDFMKIASALVVNVGTLTPQWVESMTLAAHAANTLGKVWVLDPVGCGATPYRTEVCRQLVALKPTLVRGNASEILALHAAACSTSESGKSDGVPVTKGVDSTVASNEAVSAAVALAQEYGICIAVSGAVDYVTDGQRVIQVRNGVPMLQAITATGCSVTAVCAACCAVSDKEKRLEAAAAGLALYGVAAELAAQDAKGPGSLRVALLDWLYNLQQTDVEKLAKFS